MASDSGSAYAGPTKYRAYCRTASRTSAFGFQPSALQTILFTSSLQPSEYVRKSGETDSQRWNAAA